MTIRKRLAVLGVFAGLFPAGQVLAAPYCVQTEAVPPQCIYNDPGLCQTRAFQLGGWCTPNPVGVEVPATQARFCLLISGATSCRYADQNLCLRDAVQQHGACISAPVTTGANIAPNPYANRALLPGG